MFRRPRRGALGLRGRIVGAVLVTTVATLVVAALALLGPLEQSLRNAALKTLQHDLRTGNIKLSPFEAPVLVQALDTGEIPQQQRVNVQRGEKAVGNRTGATLILAGYSDRSEHANPFNPADRS